MRNRIDDELQHIRKEARTTAQLSNPSPDPDPNPSPNQARTVTFALPAHSAYEALLKQHQLSGWSPPRAQVLYLPVSPHISPYLPISPGWSPSRAQVMTPALTLTLSLTLTLRRAPSLLGRVWSSSTASALASTTPPAALSR